MIRVVVVDDQELVRAGFRALLDADPGIEVVAEAGDGPDLRDAQGSDRHVIIDHARQALDLFETGGNRTGQARALNVIGWEYSRLGDYQRALATCRRALALQEEIGDRHDQSIAWDSIGYTYHQLGDYPKAIASYQQALALLRGYGDRLSEAETLDHLGDSYQAVGQPDDARTVWRNATTILDELAHPHADQVRAKLADQAGGSVSRYVVVAVPDQIAAASAGESGPSASASASTTRS